MIKMSNEGRLNDGTEWNVIHPLKRLLIKLSKTSEKS